MRVSLPTDFAARLSSSSKDARMVNGVKEEKHDGPVVMNRPGLISTGYNYANGQGLLGLNGFLYLIHGDEFELSPYDGTPLPPIPPIVGIGDLVDGYYAMVDGPTTSPGAGDPYWSVTPPGSIRYRALPFYAEYYISVAKASTGPFRDMPYTRRAASNDAVVKLFGELMGVEDNFLAYDSSDGDQYEQWAPNGVWNMYISRIKPEGTYSYSSSYISVSNWRVATQRSHFDWVPTWNPSGVSSSYGGLLGFPGQVGVIKTEKTKTSCPIYRVGTELRINYSDLSSYAEPFFSQLTRADISGCDQPEYNGSFDLIAHYDGSSYYPDYYYIDIGSTPSTPATGTRTVRYYE